MEVRATYDRIAAHFAKTREHPWPEVEAFLDDRADGPVDLALDLGCGNARHAELLADHARRVIGVDVSRGLLGEARDRAADRGFAIDLVQGDAAAVPLATDAVDLGVYVATIHHLRPRAQRVASLDELARVLAPGGRALVSAWSRTHDRFDGEAGAERDAGADSSATSGGFDTTVDWTLPDGETVPRFYHIYDPAEFAADLAASDLAVVERFLASGNCYAEVKGKRP